MSEAERIADHVATRLFATGMTVRAALVLAAELGRTASLPLKTTALTPRQGDLLRFIEAYGDEHSYAPTLAEMAEALGLRSKSDVHRILGALEERGCVRRLPNRARAIELLRTAATPSERNAAA